MSTIELLESLSWCTTLFVVYLLLLGHGIVGLTCFFYFILCFREIWGKLEREL